MRGQAAFTLAEVLITLAVIGVVAAMTIPTLMTQIRWIVLKQQYKESFSTLNQALRLVYEKSDMIYDCYYQTTDSLGHYEQGPQDAQQCTLLYNDLKEVLKVATVCENKAYENGCIPKYRGIDDIYNDLNPDNEYTSGGCTGFETSNILNRNPAWVLADGTIIGFYKPLPNPFPKIFFVDINGDKKPNKWGYDIFSMMIMSNGQKLYLKPGGCSYVEKGGKTGKQMLE